MTEIERAFAELVTAVMQNDHPSLPRPEWPQDVAYLALVIDRLTEKAWMYDELAR